MSVVLSVVELAQTADHCERTVDRSDRSRPMARSPTGCRRSKTPIEYIRWTMDGYLSPANIARCSIRTERTQNHTKRRPADNTRLSSNIETRADSYSRKYLVGIVVFASIFSLRSETAGSRALGLHFEVSPNALQTVLWFSTELCHPTVPALSVAERPKLLALSVRLAVFGVLVTVVTTGVCFAVFGVLVAILFISVCLTVFGLFTAP